MEKLSLLLVDDEPTNLHILNGIFGDLYEVSFATDGLSALQLAQEILPDLIILDIMMPVLDGFDTCARLQKIPALKHIPVVFLTALADTDNEAKGLDAGAQDYLSKPVNAKIALKRVATLLEKSQLTKNLAVKNTELAAINAHLEDIVSQRTASLTVANKKLNEAYISVTKSFSTMAELGNPYMPGHGKRVAEITQRMGRALRLTSDELNHLLVASLLHDIGFLTLPDVITSKAVDCLGEDSLRSYENHVTVGTNALSTIGDDLQKVSNIIALHHEKYDGTGYPRQLSGDKISISGRILTIADHYDELCSGHITGTRMPVAQAVKLIESRKGTYFDPSLVEVFRLVIEGKDLADERIHALRVSEISAGMILAKDIVSIKGQILLAKNQILTFPLLQKLKEYDASLGNKLLVFVSIPQEDTAKFDS